MARLSQIIRKVDTITVEIDGRDEDGNAIKVPIRVTYLPRKKTLEWRGRFADHLGVLERFEDESKAAAERGAEQAELARMADDAKIEQHANAMSAMTLELLDSWDLEDENDDGELAPVPIPKTTEAVAAFPDPELFGQVMKSVMAALNPNPIADEPSEKDSSAT